MKRLFVMFGPFTALRLQMFLLIHVHGRGFAIYVLSYKVCIVLSVLMIMLFLFHN